jgi:hypothetical protein
MNTGGGGTTTHGPTTGGATNMNTGGGGTTTHGPTTGGATNMNTGGGGTTTHGPTTGGANMQTHGPTTGGATTHGPTTGGATTHGPTTGGATTHGPTTGGATTHGPTTGGAATDGGITQTHPIDITNGSISHAAVANAGENAHPISRNLTGGGSEELAANVAGSSYAPWRNAAGSDYAPADNAAATGNAVVRIGGESLRANGEVAQGFQYTGPCPVELQFGWGVIASEPTSIDYRFVRSDGGQSARSQTVDLPRAESSVPVYDMWRLGANTPQFANFTGWVKIVIDSPNQVEGKIGFTIHCR